MLVPPPRRRLVAGLLAILLVGLACPTAFAAARETATADLAKDLSSDDPKTRQEALRGLRHKGAEAVEAVPALVDALGQLDNEERADAIRLLADLGRKHPDGVKLLVEALAQPREAQHRAAATVLMYLGAPAVPALADTIRDDLRPRARTNALVALGLLEEETRSAKKIALAALKDDEAAVRAEAAGVLTRYVAPREREVVAVVLALLKDPDLAVRRRVLVEMSRIDLPAEKAIPTLGDVLTQSDSGLAWHAAQALGRIGRRDKAALPVLLAALKNADHPANQAAAASGLGRMEANGTPAIATLGELLRKPGASDPNRARQLREAAGTALAHLGRFDEAAVALLVKELEDNKDLKEDERRNIVAEMRDLSAKGKAAVPVLLKIMREKEGAATAALQAVAGVGAEAVPPLLTLLREGDADERRLALTCLSLMGPAAKSAVPALREELKHDTPAVRRSAATTLAGIGPSAAPAVPDLLKALADTDDLVRRAAAEALGKIAPDDKRIVAALVPIVNNNKEKTSLRCAAAWSLGSTGSAGKDAVAPLLAAFSATATEDPDSPRFSARRALLQRLEASEPVEAEPRHFLQDFRASVLFALRRLGPHATEAVPRLLELVQDDKADAFERWAAAEALAVLGGDADKLVPAFTAVLKNERTPAVVQVGIVDALAGLSKPAKDTLAFLESLTKERPRAVRLAARQVMNRK